MEKKVKLPDGTKVPAIGEGSWYLGENPALYRSEKESLTEGIRAGLTLIDTAEMYGSGLAESLVGDAIQEFKREDLFLVSKVLPNNAGGRKIIRSCEESLKRLRTDYLDLYLLHWRGGFPLEETVRCMEELIRQGKIKRWGVSNFDLDDMEELMNVPGGKNCAVNQDLYHIASRGVEYSLLPWMKEHGIPLMAYCPIAQGGSLKRNLYRNPVLKKIAEAHGASVPQILLSFVIRSGNVIAIPRTGSDVHARENAAAEKIELTVEDLKAIDREFPAPEEKEPLDIC
jgi:diketogulonate reductase-like aldo/keto reductase